jgi:hypothetical protein
MKPLFWLCYRRGERLVGVVLIEAGEMIEARMLAAITGLDRMADFAEGCELRPQHRAMVSPGLIGRMLAPEEAARLATWIESEAARKNLQTTEVDRVVSATVGRDDRVARRRLSYA